MFAWFRSIDPKIKAAQCRAIEHVQQRYPNLTVTDVSLRAREPTRYVFAVFFREGDEWSMCACYKLVACDRDGEGIEELNASPDSPYWIRGLK